MKQRDDEIEVEFDVNDRKAFTDVFKKLWRAQNKRFVINVGGANSGKSHAQAQMEVIKRLQSPGYSIVFRKVMNSHKGTTLRMINQVVNDFKLIENKIVSYHKHDNEFRFINGSIIGFKGLDDVEKLKSIHRVQRVWIEEATETTKEDFHEINRRVRALDNMCISMTLNPVDIEGYIHHYFWEKTEFIEKSNIIHSTIYDNHFRVKEDEEQAEMMKEYSENDYRIYTLGEWGQLRTGNEFYFKFSIKEHVGNFNYDINSPVHISFDFNVIPYITASVWQIYPGEKYECRCIDEYTLKTPRNNTYDLCMELFEKYKNHKSQVYIYGDASGRAHHTESKEHNYDIIFRVLKKLLNNNSNRVPLINPRVDKRREFINRAFSNQKTFTIKINQSCKLMIEDLIRVKEDPAGGKLKVKSKENNITFERWGHLSDSLDYFVCAAFFNSFNNA